MSETFVEHIFAFSKILKLQYNLHFLPLGASLIYVSFKLLTTTNEPFRFRSFHQRRSFWCSMLFLPKNDINFMSSFIPNINFSNQLASITMGKPKKEKKSHAKSQLEYEERQKKILGKERYLAKRAKHQMNLQWHKKRHW